MARSLFVALFFASGATALVYQTIWQRLLTFTTGTDVHSLTTVVAAFMAGLGVGSLAGGVLADRLDLRRRWLAFGACELAIAGFAAVSGSLYYDVLYVRLVSSTESRALPVVLGFLAMLWPTFFMGMSLPLAARLVSVDRRHPGEWIPVLYGWNTLGAAVGAVLSVTVLFRFLGFGPSLLIGAATNGLFGVVAVAMWATGAGWRIRNVESHRPAPEAGPRVSPSDAHLMPTMGSWAAAYALAGFTALSLEVVWFRVLGVVMKSTSMTFGLLLGMYLGGLGLGSLAGRRGVGRRLGPTRAFLWFQAAIPIYAALAAAALIWLIDLPAAEGFREYLGGYKGPSLAAAWSPVFLAVNLLVPVLLMGPPTFLMGLSFASLQEAVQTDLDLVGRRVGWLQASNILGAVVGAGVTGYALLDWIGAMGTLKLLVASAAYFLWRLTGFRRVASRPAAWASAGGAAALLIATGYAVPVAGVMWPRLHNAPRDAVFAEDASGLALFRPEGNGTTVVFVNGVGQSRLPYGELHTVLGALPAMMHERPERIAVIGLGSGDTTFAAGGRAETLRVDSIEIVGAMVSSLRRFGEATGAPGVGDLFLDPRIRHHVGDGRSFLARSAPDYDIIEADALQPTSAHAGSLYSVEYFNLLRSRLRDGGYAVTWLPTSRTLDSLVAAFPYVVAAGQIGIASSTPVAFNPEDIRRRIADPRVRAYYARAGVDLASKLEPYLSEPPRVFGPGTSRSPLSKLNHDLFPRDEFMR